jgi:hypothetical protein
MLLPTDSSIEVLPEAHCLSTAGMSEVCFSSASHLVYRTRRSGVDRAEKGEAFDNHPITYAVLRSKKAQCKVSKIRVC